MAKNALLDEDLLADALVDVVDDIRRDVHEALGTRQWSVSVVTRRWSGATRGEGNATVNVLELDPTPMVRRSTRDRLGPAGREAAGTMIITGVSLRYTEEELQPKVDARTEVGYKLVEKHGQREKTIWCVLSADPIPRRGDKAGDETDWYLVLNETSDIANLDGVNG